MPCAKLEGGGNGAGGGRGEKQREAAARGAAIQTIVADAERRLQEAQWLQGGLLYARKRREGGKEGGEREDRYIGKGAKERSKRSR
jgi:hypothetical protein